MSDTAVTSNPAASRSPRPGGARQVLLDSMTETELLEALRAAARRFGWFCYHTYRSQNSEDGFPDLVLLRGGRLMFWELKSAKGQPTAEQQRWLAELTAAGVEARVVRPADYDECLDLLRDG